MPEEYSKTDVLAFAAAIDKLLVACLDGVGADDLDEAIGVATASARAVNELKTEPGAAGCHIVGYLADAQGDRMLERGAAEE